MTDVVKKAVYCANAPRCYIPVDPGYAKCTRCEADERGTLHILVIREREAKRSPPSKGGW